MGSKIQIFVGNDSLDIIDFYPDDLPNDWQFDYYSSKANALMLHHDSNQDFEEIFENIDRGFKLIIDIGDVNSIKDFNSFMQPISKYKKLFILYATTNDKELIHRMQSYNFCIYTSSQALLNYKHYNNFYFNHCLVLVEEPLVDEKEIRKKVEYFATIGENVVYIQQSSDMELLEKTRIIVDLLGFY